MRFMLIGASVATALSMALSPLAATRAEDIETFNFNKSESGWIPDLAAWAYSKQSADEGSWKFSSTGSGTVAAYLYSPCLTVTDPKGEVTFDFNNGHKFNFGSPAPPSDPNFIGGAGQVQYSLDDGLTWSGVPENLWSSQGVNIPPTLDPNDITSPAPLLTSGMAFQGTSGGVNYIASAFTLPLGVGAIGSDVQFRLLGNIRNVAVMPTGIAWDVDKIQIKGVVQCVPEPGTIALATTGGVLSWIGLNRRRRRSRRNVSLSEC